MWSSVMEVPNRSGVVADPSWNAAGPLLTVRSSSSGREGTIMKLRTVRVLAICGAMVLLACVPGTAGARSAAGRHCAVRLEPTSYPKPNVILARAVRVGCYDTLSEAVEAGSGGAIRLPRNTTPQELTDELIARSTVTARIGGGTTLIGTEWMGLSYSGGSRSWYAPDACIGNTWETDYVGDSWNDVFDSGKGFGGCDTNKKFVHANFGGDVLTCTPNCADYGALQNEVSSLRWKP
jgi:hypothetical protein